MDALMEKYLKSIGLGEPSTYQNMTVVPLFVEKVPALEYILLREAIEQKLLKVTEVSRGGSVPELKVVNDAATAVLVLDGEELAGAKQNRVLNTTILIREKWSTLIPVSCTEHGRWSYRSAHFETSDAFMPYELRTKKNFSVNMSLKMSKLHRADQGKIWNDIDDLRNKAGVRSQTGAMKDIFDNKKTDLESYLAQIKPMPGQKGMLVIINGMVAGMDMVSRDDAYNKIHTNLLRSYAMDAMLHREDEPAANAAAIARQFLNEAAACEEEKYDAIGYGQDYRYEGKDILGSALVHRDEVVHAVFHRLSKDPYFSRMRHHS